MSNYHLNTFVFVSFHPEINASKIILDVILLGMWDPDKNINVENPVKMLVR